MSATERHRDALPVAAAAPSRATTRHKLTLAYKATSTLGQPAKGSLVAEGPRMCLVAWGSKAPGSLGPATLNNKEATSPWTILRGQVVRHA